jgi:hypothetical protein
MQAIHHWMGNVLAPLSKLDEILLLELNLIKVTV